MKTKRCTTTLGVVRPGRILRCELLDDCDHGENHLFLDPVTNKKVLAEVDRLPMGSKGFVAVMKGEEVKV